MRPHAGICPTVEVEPLFFGICASGCENDNGCLETQKCCPTACGGTSCMDVIVSGKITQKYFSKFAILLSKFASYLSRPVYNTEFSLLYIQYLCMKMTKGKNVADVCFVSP